MLRLLLIVFIATLLGCGRGGGLQGGAGTAGAQGEWFCEMAENAEDWDCIQDSELARNPIPSRLPEPKPAAASRTPAATAAASLDANPAQPPPIEPLLAEPPPPPPPPTSVTAAAADAVPAAPEETVASPLVSAAVPASDTPAHIRLAYQPQSPTPIVDMPADFYAVQLIAMSSRGRLEEYIDEHRLEGMTAARVERDGDLYYVLILGIYETRDLAEQASQDIPPPLDTREPWIRRLSALQEAMIRGDAMAGGAPG